MLHIVKPAAIGARRASVSVNIWQPDGPEDNPSQVLRQAAIRAELRGDNICDSCGITVRSSIPVLALCRKLVQAGHDPATPLEAYRGDTLCLRVRSIGEGARLQINSQGRGFEPYQEPRPATLARKNEGAGP
jgi:hypothetical protein